MKKAFCLLFTALLFCGAFAVFPAASGDNSQKEEGLTIDSSRLTAAQTAATDCGARYSASPADWWAEVRQEVVLRDDYVFPDRSNTGRVSASGKLRAFSDKYPQVERSVQSWGGNYTTYYITESAAALYDYCFEGFYAKNAFFIFSNKSEVLMRDFSLDAGSNVCGIRTALSESQGRVYLCDAEMTGSVSALLYGCNITALRCYLHDVYADHAKGFSGQQYISCYFSRGGLNGGNPHPDCLQISGDNSRGGPMNVDNVLLYGNRIDAMPTAGTATNACIIIKSEFGAGFSNIQIRRNWINGGNCPIQIGCGAAKMAYYRDVSVSDNYFGNSLSPMFSFTSAYADSLRENGTFTGNQRIDAPEAGSIFLTVDGKRVSSADELAGKEALVRILLSNYAATAAEGYIRVSLCDAAGNVRAFTDTAFAIDRLLTQSESKAIAGFFYDDQPLDRIYKASLPAAEMSEGDYYIVSVVKLRQDDAADILRSTTLLTGDVTKEHTLTLPAGYLPVERDPDAPAARFISAVEACADVTGEELRAALVAALGLWKGADDNVYGTTNAKKWLSDHLMQFNAAVTAANETAENSAALLGRMVPTMQKIRTGLVRVLGRVCRTIPFSVKGGSLL